MRPVIWTLFLLLPLTCTAYYNPGTPTGFVNDYTNTLSATQKQTIETELKALEQETKSEVVIAIIQDLRDDTIENVAEHLFKEWGIGKKGADNGVLLLLSLKEHKMRIEVGYGLEGAITDAQTHDIIAHILKPAFKAGNFYGGIADATHALSKLIKKEPLEIKKTQPDWLTEHKGAIVIAVFLLMLLFLIFVARFKKRAPRKYYETDHQPRPPFWFWGGPPSSGPKDNDFFGGFGGGKSGGGGSSGDW